MRPLPNICASRGKAPVASWAEAKCMSMVASVAASRSAWPKTKSSTVASSVIFCFAVMEVSASASRHCSAWRIALIPGGADNIDQGPGMTDVHRMGSLGDLEHGAPPILWKGRKQGLAHERIVHHCDQIVFGFHVIVKAHRSHFELLRYAAHRNRRETLLVCNGKCYGGNLFAGQSLSRQP